MNDFARFIRYNRILNFCIKFKIVNINESQKNTHLFLGCFNDKFAN